MGAAAPQAELPKKASGLEFLGLRIYVGDHPRGYIGLYRDI